MIVIDLMITVESVQMPSKEKKSKITLKCVIITFFLLVAALVFAIYWFGQPKQHESTNHKLYGVFNQSVEHQKLTKKIDRSQTVIIVGSQNSGLENYIEHYANMQVQKGRKVNIV